MPASTGDTVRVHYTGTLSDGTRFDSSEGRDPLQFSLGAGQVVPGFDKAVDGMTVGETKTVTIPAKEAYGEPDPHQVVQVPKSQLPPGAEVSIGDQLQIGTEDGRAMIVRVAEVGDDAILLDANHPLAGEDLTFEITLDSIA
ncbi:MAG: peptidylprolyl isomerase [Bacteroidota bacterium]